MGVKMGIDLGTGTQAGVEVQAGINISVGIPDNIKFESAGRPQFQTQFGKRRVLNWLTLGFTYSAMYMGRYNLPMVNPILSKNYGWDKAQIGSIISPALLAYGLFAMFNGPIS